VYFDQEFIDSVEEDPLKGIVDICSLISNQAQLDTILSNGWTEKQHEIMWEAASFIDVIITVNDLNFELELPATTANVVDNCTQLKRYLVEARTTFKNNLTELRVESYKSRYTTALKASFAYEFSQGDLDRVQALVNEIREHISANIDLDDDHKQRLLKRLELLQSELHKRVSDLDRFWGLIGDAGVVLGKLGTDAKPIVDRIKEVAGIVWKTQARTEELPSDLGNPVLGQDD
jgi:hypothetical protein